MEELEDKGLGKQASGQTESGTPIEQTEEYQRFKDFARRLMAVPKQELNEQLAKTAENKKSRKAQTADSNPSPKPI
jgi:hypothetical protein